MHAGHRLHFACSFAPRSWLPVQCPSLIGHSCSATYDKTAGLGIALDRLPPPFPQRSSYICARDSDVSITPISVGFSVLDRHRRPILIFCLRMRMAEIPFLTYLVPQPQGCRQGSILLPSPPFLLRLVRVDSTLLHTTTTTTHHVIRR
jgi:hypothetical protein